MKPPDGFRVDVGRGAGPVRPIQACPVPLLELPVPGLGTADITLGESLVRTATDAFIVLHEGRLVLEWYAQPDGADSLHALFSVSKSLVGCVCGILVGGGVLDPEAPAEHWVPELVGSGYAGVTVRDLLDMRTGGDQCESYDDPAGEVGRLGVVLGAQPPGQAPRGLDELVVSVTRRARHQGPFSYRSLDTEVLGWVAERAAGRSMPRLVEELLLAPLGAERGGSMATDATGRASHSGGLALSPRDLARFGQLLADGGSVGERQVVPTTWIKDIRVGAPDSVDAFRASLRGGSAEASGIPVAHYRNQFWVLQKGGRELVALGIFGQYVLVDAEAATVVVKLSSWAAPQDPRALSEGLACATTVSEHLGGHASEDINLHA